VTVRDRPLRFLVVDASVDETATLASVRAAIPPSSDVERMATMNEALARLDGEPPVDVVLLDPDVPDRTVLEAFAATHARAPDVPVVVLTRVEGDHFALAIAAVTRSPQSAAAGARRIATLLPRYLEHREADLTTLRDALEREDYEAVARIGHNLRGNGVSFGFPELRAIGERIEAAARIRSRPDLREPTARLRDYLDGVLGRGRAAGAAPRRPASGTRARAMPPDDARLAGKK
jgi:HPt (histidine-containing phosphotransfer) domain-containing protein